MILTTLLAIGDAQAGPMPKLKDFGQNDCHFELQKNGTYKLVCDVETDDDGDGSAAGSRDTWIGGVIVPREPDENFPITWDFDTLSWVYDAHAGVVYGAATLGDVIAAGGRDWAMGMSSSAMPSDAWVPVIGIEVALGGGDLADLDGDGSDELVLGAPGADLSGRGSGGAYIFSSALQAASYDTRDADTWVGGYYSYGFGVGDDVENVGDVDGDGYEDVDLQLGAYPAYAVRLHGAPLERLPTSFGSGYLVR